MRSVKGGDMNGNAVGASMLGFDWAQAWRELDAERANPDDPAAWDARAASFPTKHGSQAGYVGSFLELAGIKPGETVLDIGCGTGSLATPLALAGNAVIACDFSSGMMAEMLKDQAALGISNVRAIQMSWQDDWDEYGVGSGCADVAIASRSIATADLEESLLKLTRAARRRVCITMPRSATPRIDDELLTLVGYSARRPPDFVYAFNILATHGIKPEVRYIDNTREETFDSREDAIELLWGLVEQCSDPAAREIDPGFARKRIGAWLDDGNLVENPAAGEAGRRGVPQKRLKLARPRNVAWAFLAWDL